MRARSGNVAADPDNLCGGGRFYCLSQLERRCNGARHKRRSRVSAPPCGLSFRALRGVLLLALATYQPSSPAERFAGISMVASVARPALGPHAPLGRYSKIRPVSRVRPSVAGRPLPATRNIGHVLTASLLYALLFAVAFPLEVA